MSKLVVSTRGRHYSCIHEQMSAAAQVELAVAYVQQSGVNALCNQIARICSEGGGVRIVCSFDMGITDPNAINELRELGADIRIYEARRGTFHPKIWLFGNADGAWRSLVGSANLTAGAMFDNVEASVLSDNDDLVRQARAAFGELWEQSHAVSEEDIQKWQNIRQRRADIIRQAAAHEPEQRGDAGIIDTLKEFVFGWIDTGLEESARGARQVIGRKWRGWYIIPDQGEIDDVHMQRLADICRIVREQAGGRLDISRQASEQEGGEFRAVLAITSAKFQRANRKMTDRDLFVRQEKNYLIHLGLAEAPDKNTLVLSPYGMALSSANDATEARRIYTDAMEGYLHGGLCILAFVRRLLARVGRIDFNEFSFFACHAWSMNEMDTIASMIKMYRRLPDASRHTLIAEIDNHFQEVLEPTASGVRMNYNKHVCHTMSALGWCTGISYNKAAKTLLALDR